MAGLVRGVSGVVRSVSFADGLISVVVECGAHFGSGSGKDVVVRHRVGARGGIPVEASRELWKYLVSLRKVRLPVEFSGRPGWAGWFDEVDVSFEYLRAVFDAADAREEEEYLQAEESALELYHNEMDELRSCYLSGATDQM